MGGTAGILSWIAGLPADLRLGVRRLWRRPAFTLSAVLIFGVGTGFATGLAGVYRALFLRPLPFAAEDRLVAVRSTFPDAKGKPQELASSGFDYLAFAQARSFAVLGGHTPRDLSVHLGDRVEQIDAEAVTASLFRALGAGVVLGRLPNEDDERQGIDVTVLTWEFWTRRMAADSTVVGRPLRIDGRPYVVLGILKPGFTTLFQNSELYVPLVLTPATQTPTQRRTFALTARLAPGVSMVQAQSELAGIADRQAREFPEVDRGWGVSIKPLREQYFGSRRPLFRLLFAGVGLVLLIGCANLAHLSLANATARRGEFALRTVLGAARSHLLRQQMAESLLLALGGGAAGLAIAAVAIRMVLGLDADIGRLAGPVSLDPGLAGFALLIALIASVVGSALPSAFASMGFSAIRAGTRSSGSRSDRVLRQGMLAGEVAVGLVLLVGGAVVVAGLRSSVNEDPGFEPAGLVASEIVLPAARYAEAPQRAEFVRRLLESLRGAPGITSATTTMTRFRAAQSMSSMIQGEGAEGDPELPQSVSMRRISTGYLATMKARLISGREFTDADDAVAPRVALISESLARRFWPGKDALGRRYRRPGAPDWVNIVGVVADIRDAGPGFDLGPMILVPYAQSNVAGVSFAPVTVVLRSNLSVAEAAGVIRRSVAAIDPDLALEMPQAVEEHLSAALAPQRFQAMLIGAFAATALFLVAAGLYGVTAYGVSLRRREIGIRLALGSPRVRVIRLVLRQALAPLVVGTGIGLVASGWVTTLASRLLPTPAAPVPEVVVLVTGFLATIGLLATGVPALRASRVDPSATLKEENA